MKTTNVINKACSLLRAFAFSFLVILFFHPAAYSQCLTNNLIINVGEYNYTSYAPGSTDPLWTISDKSSAYIPGSPAIGANAEVVNPLGGWGFVAGVGWISDNQPHASWLAPPAGVSDYMTFKREFRTCQDGDITFDAYILVDNYVKEVKVDGITVPGVSQPFGTYLSGTPWHMNFTQTLAFGSHSLEIVVGEDNNFNSNPIGLALAGNITSLSNIIVNNYDGSCGNYQCNVQEECDDKCFWKLTGNTIATNHIFGTRNKFSVDIMTENSYRGILTPGGPNTTDPVAGRLGWNTMNPTARLHVDCRYGNNPGNVMGLPSDIRFENLEPGRGNILVIDQQGYVYDSKIPAQGKGDASDGGMAVLALQQEVRELKIQLADLRRTLATDQATFNGNTLDQNTPNPFDRETVIEFSIGTMGQSAYVGIYDMNGREIMKYPVGAAGKGSVTVDGSSLQPGMYLYSLVVDGKVTDTKRMVLSK